VTHSSHQQVSLCLYTLSNKRENIISMEVNNIAQNKGKIKSVVFKGILKLILEFFCIS
jgi:hypothetical protein